MIVSRRGDRFEVITQPDHARLAAQILALWREDSLLQNPRRSDLLLAVREHDNGWREPDAAPRIDPDTGGPTDFRRYPREGRAELWQRAVHRLRETPYAAALVAHHALEIHRGRGHALWRTFFGEMEAQREGHLEAAGAGREELDRDYAWLELSDRLSLAACGALPGPQRARGYRFRADERTVQVDPFPLAGATTFVIPLRDMPLQRYADSVALATRLAAARWQRQPLRITPWPA